MWRVAKPAKFSMVRIDAKMEQLSRPGTTAKDVLRVLGEPRKYAWGRETFGKNSLPETYVAAYPAGVSVLISEGRVVELRSEGGKSNGLA